MLLTPSRHRRIASVAPILALVICLPATALPAPPRHDPGDDSSFLCDLLGIFCGPDPGSDPDHTPPVPESGLARGHRSVDPEKSFPALQAEPPPPAPPSPVVTPPPPPTPPSPKH